MGYGVSLVHASTKKTVIVDVHTEGSTYAIGGSSNASMGITYNYAKFYYTVIDQDDGLRWLHHRTAKETVPVLKHAIEAIGNLPPDTQQYYTLNIGDFIGDRIPKWYRELYFSLDVAELNSQEYEEFVEIGLSRNWIKPLGDYWEPKPCNAKRALEPLVSWGEQHPNAIWLIEA